MTKRDLDGDELREAVRSRGFQPARADVEGLFAQLVGPDEDAAETAERALARLGLEAARDAMARLAGAKPPGRGRLCRLVGRVAGTTPAGDVRRFLAERLDDPDAKTRRNAIIALGKVGGPGVEAQLRARFAEASVEHQRSIAAALGKIGGAEALALLSAVETDDKELTRIVAEARLKLERTLRRAGPAEAQGRIDPGRASTSPTPVVVHCRDGLETLVVDELHPRLKARATAPGRVEARLSGPLEQLYASRTMLRFGFPLPAPQSAKAPGEIGPAVVEAITSDVAWRVFSAFTDGPIRYRIEWASGGHRRGLTFQTAQAVSRVRPALVNDPTESLWEVVVTEVGGLAVELWPRGLADARFAYRTAHVPASSHPTLAAALARVAGARPDDVVWDPFAGAGTELVERAKLGPYKRLYGSDVDQPALDRARENLTAAGLADVELLLADAREHEPAERPTLIVTNPPMGRRVLNKRLTGALYDAFLEHAARVLSPGGRLVWISPRPKDTSERALALGFTISYRQRVDMGGFWAEIQAFTTKKRGGAR